MNLCLIPEDQIATKLTTRLRMPVLAKMRKGRITVFVDQLNFMSVNVGAEFVTTAVSGAFLKHKTAVLDVLRSSVAPAAAR